MFGDIRCVLGSNSSWKFLFYRFVSTFIAHSQTLYLLNWLFLIFRIVSKRKLHFLLEKVKKCHWYGKERQSCHTKGRLMIIAELLRSDFVLYLVYFATTLNFVTTLNCEVDEYRQGNSGYVYICGLHSIIRFRLHKISRMSQKHHN